LLIIDEGKTNSNTISQGRKIIDEIKSEEDNIINKAECFLTNINLKTNDKIF
jgi:hypothetical protein